LAAILKVNPTAMCSKQFLLKTVWNRRGNIAL